MTTTEATLNVRSAMRKVRDANHEAGADPIYGEAAMLKQILMDAYSWCEVIADEDENPTAQKLMSIIEVAWDAIKALQAADAEG